TVGGQPRHLLDGLANASDGRPLADLQLRPRLSRNWGCYQRPDPDTSGARMPPDGRSRSAAVALEATFEAVRLVGIWSGAQEYQRGAYRHRLLVGGVGRCKEGVGGQGQ